MSKISTQRNVGIVNAKDSNKKLTVVTNNNATPSLPASDTTSSNTTLTNNTSNIGNSEGMDAPQSTVSSLSIDATSSTLLPSCGMVDNEIAMVISLVRPSTASNVTREWVRRFICAVIKEAYTWVNQYLDRMGVGNIASTTAATANDAKTGQSTPSTTPSTTSSTATNSSGSITASAGGMGGNAVTSSVAAGEPFRYGSVELGTYLPTGDIDIGVVVPTPFLPLWFETLRGFLQAQKCVRGVTLVDAEIKLIKCLIGNIVVDISANTDSALLTVNFFKRINETIARQTGIPDLFQQSLLLIKAWCMFEAKILLSQNSMLSTYSLHVMVVHIIDRYHRSVRTPFHVFCRFLEYYSEFEFASTCLTVHGPVKMASVYRQTWEYDRPKDALFPESFWTQCMTDFGQKPSEERMFPTKFVNIMDPLDPTCNLGRSVSHINFGIVVKKLQEGWAQAKEVLAAARARGDDKAAPVATSPVIPTTTSVGIAALASSTASASSTSGSALSPSDDEKDSVTQSMDLSRLVQAMFHDTIELFGRGRALFGPGGRPDVSPHDILFNTRGKKLEISQIQQDGPQAVNEDPFFPVASLMANAPQYPLYSTSPPNQSAAASPPVAAAVVTATPTVATSSSSSATPSASPNANLIPNQQRRRDRGACVTFSNAVTSRDPESAPATPRGGSPVHSPSSSPQPSPYHRYQPAPAPLPPQASPAAYPREVPRPIPVQPSAAKREAKRERSCWTALMQMSSQSDREDAEREQKRRDDEAAAARGATATPTPSVATGSGSSSAAAVSPLTSSGSGAAPGTGGNDALLKQLQEARSLAVRLQEENKALKALKNRVEAQNADLLNLREVDTWHAQVALLNQRRGLVQGGYSPATPTYAIGATLSPSIGGAPSVPSSAAAAVSSNNQYLLRATSVSPSPIVSPPYSPYSTYGHGPHSPPPAYGYAPVYPGSVTATAPTSVSPAVHAGGTSHNTMLIHHSASMSPLIAARTLYSSQPSSAQATPTAASARMHAQQQQQLPTTLVDGSSNGYH